MQRSRQLKVSIQLILEQLEARLVPTGTPVLTIPLDPNLDQFGDQILTVQAYGDSTRATSGIFDTGASAVTFAPGDQDMFTQNGNPIPIKVPGGAQASGIGGDVTGDVSQPGTILADGLHAGSVNIDDLGNITTTANFDSNSAATPGIQAFVGTQDGSPDLPTITGTPILNPSPGHPQGLAARVDLQGYQFDLSSLFPDLGLSGLSFAMPDLHFVDPGTSLTAATGDTNPVYVSLGAFGMDNHTNPGDVITESTSPDVAGVSVGNKGQTVASQNPFLLDTGSQLTVISTQMAQKLGLDLSNPDTTIDVQGVGGTETVPGFTLDKLDLPRTDGGIIEFTNVPVYVLDVDPGLDGILGMNLWDTADTLLIDPHAPGGGQLGLTFFTNPDRSGGGLDSSELSLLQSLGGAYSGAFHGNAIPDFSVPTSGSISGQVFQDANGNGQHDPGDTGQVGVRVYLDSNNNGRLDRGEMSTLTDSRGDYSFTGLKAGTFHVREVVPSGWVATSPSSMTVNLAANQQSAGDNFGNFKLGQISGQVFVDRNGNGQRDTGEPGQSGVKVYLDGNGNGKLDPGEKVVTTNGSGSFSFTNLGPGTYTVREVLPAGWLQTTASTSFSVTLTSGQNVTGDNFGNFKTISISGRVLSSNGGSVAGFVVYLDDNQNDILDSGERNVQVSSQGTYTFTGLGPGNYIVREVAPVNWTLVKPASGFFSVTATSGQNVSGDNFLNRRSTTKAPGVLH